MSFQALGCIKGPYDTETGRLAIVTPDRYEEVFDILANHFLPDEPLSQSFGVVWHEDFKNLTLDVLKDNCSVCMIDKITGKMMGIRLISFMKRTDPPPDFDTMTYEPLKELYTFLNCKNNEVDFFKRYEIEEAFHFYTLGVHKDFRRLGLGSRLLQAGVALGKELGLQAIKGEGTSTFSQQIYEKNDFDILATMPYDQYTYKGRRLSEGTGEHTMTKVYGLKLTSAVTK